MAHAATAHAPAHHAGHGTHPAPAAAHDAPHTAEHDEHHEEHAGHGSHGHSKAKKMIGIAFRLCIDFVGTALFINFVSLLCGITPVTMLRHHLWRWEVLKLGWLRMWHAMHLSLGDVGMATLYNFSGFGGNTQHIERFACFSFGADVVGWLIVFTISGLLFHKTWLGGTLLVWSSAMLVYLVVMWATQALGPLWIVLLVVVFGGGAIVGLGWAATRYLWNLAEDSGH